MNKNSNTYQILYAAIMVIVVGAVLALVAMALKPRQDENIANDKRKQILGAVHQTPANDAELKDCFQKLIVDEYLVDTEGNVLKVGEGVAFEVDMSKNVKASERQLPVFVCDLKENGIKYIIPVYGAGLWGPIWGYVAMNDDGKTIYGANFSHKSETPGLGARITEDEFTKRFENKEIYKDGEFKSVVALKSGQKSTNGADGIDAISGATITSRGVQAMLEDCMKHYDAFFKKLQNGTFNR